MHEDNKKDEPLTKADMTKMIEAFSRVAKEISGEDSDNDSVNKSDTQSEQEPVTQTLNG